MNDNAKIEELSHEVRRLRRRVTWISFLLVILVVLYIITDLPVLFTTLASDPLFQMIVLITLGFVVFLIALVEVDLHWGLGKSE